MDPRLVKNDEGFCYDIFDGKWFIEKNKNLNGNEIK